MATIQRFEDLQSWQKARQLANAVYALTNQSGFAKDFQRHDQIRDAAGPVMHSTPAELKTAYDLATEAKRLINGLIAYLRKQWSNRAAERSQKRAK